jgi:hypothetical protein
MELRLVTIWRHRPRLILPHRERQVDERRETQEPSDLDRATSGTRGCRFAHPGYTIASMKNCLNEEPASRVELR